MSFESERIAGERMDRINARFSEYLEQLGRKPTPDDIIAAIAAAEAAENPNLGELSYEIDE